MAAYSFPLIALALFLGGWEVAYEVGWVSPYLVAAPSQVAISLVRDRGELWPAFLATSLCAIAGFVLSACLGVFAAVGLFSFQWARFAFYPYAVVLQTVPIVAIAPLLVIWFGFGAPTVIASASLACLFPIIMSTLNGLGATGPELKDLFRLYRSTKKDLLFKLLLPMALPEILTGLRIASGLAVIGAIVGEFVGGGGLGSVVDAARTQQRLDVVFAAVFLASTLGGLSVLGIDLVNWAVLRRWNPRVQKE